MRNSYHKLGPGFRCAQSGLRLLVKGAVAGFDNRLPLRHGLVRIEAGRGRWISWPLM
jgi:hypothetical protein